MKALDVMVRNVVTVKPDDAVADAVRLLAEHDISALPVVDRATGRVLGMLSRHHILAAYERAVAGTPADEATEPAASGQSVA